MTASVPSGFSRDDLEKLLKTAPIDSVDAVDAFVKDDDDESRFGPQKLTEDDLIEAASKICDDAMEVCADPLLHKAIALTICARMINWHNSVAEGQESEESRASGTVMQVSSKEYWIFLLPSPLVQMILS